jgi:LruC domain-containing protein/uncharacterized repeat protein (TIGR01451 family)
MKTINSIIMSPNKLTFKLIVILCLVLSTSFIGFGQSFVLDLQHNPMSFTNAQRTMLTNTGNNGTNAGSVHKYSNVITKDGIIVYAILTIVEKNNASITVFDDDNVDGEQHRFQPRIGANSGGGYVLYQLEFFNTADNQPVFVYNYYMTGVDIDGSSSSNREYIEVGGFTSYQVNSSTLLTISTNNTTGRTRFLGRPSDLSGITFDNTASMIANFMNPNNKITFVLGQTSSNNERQYSVQFGIAGGLFSEPVVVNNPLPIAVDDNGIPVNSGSGGTAVVSVLSNDLYNGMAINPADVNLSVVTPASNPGIVLNTSTGAVTVAPGTPAGNYTLIYQICMVANGTNCDVATVFITVNAADLSIGKTTNQGTVVAGQGVVYTITVTNNGPSTASDVVSHDVLPNGLILVSGTPSVGTFTAPDWTIGSLASGAMATLTIIATTDIGFSGVITNQATVSSATTDPELANNTASCSITVTPPVPISNNYPATGYGTLAFEDLWPNKGDYDFNDMVIDYKFEITSDANNMVNNVKATFILKAYGAGLHNGFGFQFPGTITPSDLTVTGSRLTESYITLNGNGTEAGQSKPTFILFDDTYSQMAYPGSGIGVNTDPASPYVTPVTMEMNIAFKPNTYSLNDLDISNFNPFIFVGQNRGTEVHLPDYLPTALANQGLLGTGEDDSNPATGKYYKTSNNLPWAINIFESFNYPVEKVEISRAYNHFIEWGESGGQLYPDWYQDKPGYRNATNIY